MSRPQQTHGLVGKYRLLPLWFMIRGVLFAPALYFLGYLLQGFEHHNIGG
jgi:hypothetical protein